MAHKLFAHTMILLFICSFQVSLTLADSTPVLNKGEKWRIGYYEGGAYSDYTDTMRTLVKGLIASGWIKDETPPDQFHEIPKPYWEWLSQCKSPFLSFKSEDSYSANWDDAQRQQIRKVLLKRLKAGELDLIIAMGTWAGQDLATNEHAVPTIVLSTSNPIKAGIITSADDSGYDHVTARIDPTRYLRQLRMFHRIVGFKTLGIAYEDTADGKLYSAMEDVQQIARERGFKFITCKVPETLDLEKADRACTDCYRWLAQKADAVYVTALTCVDRRVAEFAEIFRTAGIPSFSMVGSKYVKEGIMLSISSDSGYERLGRYNAMKIGEMLNGTQAILLKQLFEDPLDISVNINTIRQIGFDLPQSILNISREIYE